MYWSSAAVAYPLRGLTHCVFRDALLHTTVVMHGYLCNCHLPFSFDLSGPSPLTSLINNMFLLAELLLTVFFFFFAPFSANSRGCCAWKPQETSEILKSPCLAPIIHSQSYLDHISSPFWHLVRTKTEPLDQSACIYAFSCCHMIGWWNICINWCAGLPNALLTECI